MANLLSIANGNWTTGTTWGVVDATSAIVLAPTNADGLSTSNMDSQTFTPGAITVLGVALRLSSRAAGSPTNTLTVTLRNFTDSVNVTSVTINVSDLPVCGSGEDEGGWFYCKFSASQLLVAGKAYLIRVAMSSTSTAVALNNNGVTSFNWQRLLVTSTTQVPAAGDNLYILGEYDGATNPATFSARTVTMDSTAATDYGSANTSYRIPALSISKGGTLTWGVAASTNYILQLSGHLVTHSGATYNQGTSGAEIPRNSTATLQFDCAADGDFGYVARNGSVNNFYGLSRTVGKNITWALLTADVASGGGSPQTWNIDQDTGWLSGDEVAIAPTTRTYTQHELRILNANAGASSIQVTVAATNVHGGVAPVQAEVILLSRNNIVRGVSATAMAYMYFRTQSALVASWMGFRYMGVNGVTNKRGHMEIETTTGSCVVTYCAFRDGEGCGFITASNATTWTCSHNVFYIIGGNGNGSIRIESPAGNTWTFDDNVIIFTPNTGFAHIGTQFGAGAITNNRVSGTGSVGFDLSNWPVGTFSGNVAHSIANFGFYCRTSPHNSVLESCKAWRNNYGFYIETTCGNLTLKTCDAFGQTQSDYCVTGTNENLILQACNANGDTTFSTPAGFIFLGSTQNRIIFNECLFGVASGILTTHTTADINFNGMSGFVDLLLNNTKLSSATKLTQDTQILAGRVRYQRYQQVTGTNKTEKYLARGVKGTSTFETTTVHATAASEKLTPNSATLKLQSGIRQVRLLNAATAAVSVYVRKDGTYNGNQLRLVVKANPSMGFLADTVVATMTVGLSTWEQLTYTTPAAPRDGVLEFFVDCDGTVGNAFVAEFVGDGATYNDLQWMNGEPAVGPSGSGSGPGGAVTTAHAYIG